jgi:hypothetical protein
MPNLKNGRPAPIFVGGSVLWETDYSQKPDPKSKQNQWKLIMLHMRPNMPLHTVAVTHPKVEIERFL